MTFFEILSALFLSFSLGIKHGLGLDHLAIINVLTKENIERPKLAKNTGLIFASGHGLFMQLLIIYFIVFPLHEGGLGSVAPYLLFTGEGISIISLLLFGLLSLQFSHKHRFGRALMRYLPYKSPIGIFIMGVLFAVSIENFIMLFFFDLFWPNQTFILGLAFSLGMVLADTADSYFTAFALRKSKWQGKSWRLALGVFISVFSIAWGITELGTFTRLWNVPTSFF